MTIDRRSFLGFLAAATVSGATELATTHAAIQPRIRGIAFDAFPVFDPRPIFALAEQLFPGKGAELSNAWRVRQFEYQWLRALSNQYADFWRATEDALVFAAKSLKLDLTPEKRNQLMEAYLGLKAWPDVLPALKSLKEANIRLAILSNFTPHMLAAAIKSAGLEGIFDHVLSTDRLKTYKPDPRAYQMAIDAFKLKREEILFVPFAGWDAAGAKWFGYRTFWVNRLNAPVEELGMAPDVTGGNLTELVSYVSAATG
ncbi:MAG: haloacid dehalogenase type II [Gammaproteobacteria bacterium]|nr:haloacid dehalogenase type II [Gammaproteobacteria bacterium]